MLMILWSHGSYSLPQWMTTKTINFYRSSIVVNIAATAEVASWERTAGWKIGWCGWEKGERAGMKWIFMGVVCAFVKINGRSIKIIYYSLSFFLTEWILMEQ